MNELYEEDIYAFGKSPVCFSEGRELTLIIPSLTLTFFNLSFLNYVLQDMLSVITV